MTLSATIGPESAPDEERREDHYVHLRGVTWADYQRLLELRGDRSAPRITYVEGVLEIMSPSINPEAIKSTIRALVETFCLERGLDFRTLGSWTLEDKRADRGAEPDECFVFSDVEDPRRPDLAIEIVWTSGGISKLDVYRKLGVPEVWFWRRGHIEVHVMRGDAYVTVERSEALPGIDLDVVAELVDQPTTGGAVREFRERLKVEGS